MSEVPLGISRQIYCEAGFETIGSKFFGKESKKNKVSYNPELCGDEIIIIRIKRREVSADVRNRAKVILSWEDFQNVGPPFLHPK